MKFEGFLNFYLGLYKEWKQKPFLAYVKNMTESYRAMNNPAILA